MIGLSLLMTWYWHDIKIEGNELIGIGEDLTESQKESFKDKP